MLAGFIQTGEYWPQLSDSSAMTGLGIVSEYTFSPLFAFLLDFAL
ncbi:hypothetical protein Syn6312_0088 [Synechococcus sp. PCC 6312]|nr:hypothetical protein Syn6312_0088 [Synechococcus sp. PCC 6312]